MIEWLDENEFQKLGNKKRDSIGKSIASQILRID